MESYWSVFYPEKYSNPETDSDETLYMRIKRICIENPARTAIEYGNAIYSYAALLEYINEAAEAWRNLGVKKGDVVMLMMGYHPANIINVYALDKIGAASALAMPNIPTEYFVGYARIVGAKYCVMSCNQYLNYSSSLKKTGIKTVVIGRYKDLIWGRDYLAWSLYPLAAYDRPKPKSVPEGIKLVYWKDMMSSLDVLSAKKEKEWSFDSLTTQCLHAWNCGMDYTEK